jgi:hypothetical protein
MDGLDEFLRQIDRSPRVHDVRQALTITRRDDISADCSSWRKINQSRGFVVRLMRLVRVVREKVNSP